MRRILIVGCIALAVTMLAGCDLLGELFGKSDDENKDNEDTGQLATVEMSFSCSGEVMDGVGTDEDWRVSLDRGELVSANSAAGGSVVFDDVSIGTHTLYFTPPIGCYDEEVAYYDFEVRGDEFLALTEVDLMPLQSVSPRVVEPKDGGE